MLTRRVTFKLYPTQQQKTKLFEGRQLHQYLYNACLEHQIASYKRFGQSVGYYDQQNLLPEFKKVWPEYKDLGGHAPQSTVKQVEFAFQRFFKGLGKYPKFKSIRQYSGWTFPDKQSWKAKTDGKHGRLEISNLSSICMRGKARTWGLPTTCTLVYRVSEDAWYASITLECNPVQQTGDGAVGVDLGCKDASFSDGTKEAKPEFIQTGDIAVKRVSKSLRCKQQPNRKAKVKASSRWRKGQRKVSQLKWKVANPRADWLHKLTSDIVSRNSLVAGEKLNVKGMTRKAKKGSKRKAHKTGLNRSILSVGFGMIGPMLAYQEAEAGSFYLEPPTQQLKPSQRCVVCWELTPKVLADRVHHGQHCGHVEDHDTNAAQVNLRWARGQELGLTSSAESAIPTYCRSMRQMATRKRRKLHAVSEGDNETSSLYSAG